MTPILKGANMKIAGTNFQVRVVSRDETPDNDAEIYEAKSLIKICKAEPQFMQRMLWHEMLHAVLDMNGDHNLSNNEGFIDRTATLIHQIINDNPDLYGEIRTD